MDSALRSQLIRRRSLMLQAFTGVSKVEKSLSNISIEQFGQRTNKQNANKKMKLV
jgi:hypothetical protein